MVCLLNLLFPVTAHSRRHFVPQEDPALTSPSRSNPIYRQVLSDPASKWAPDHSPLSATGPPWSWSPSSLALCSVLPSSQGSLPPPLSPTILLLLCRPRQPFKMRPICSESPCGSHYTQWKSSSPHDGLQRPAMSSVPMASVNPCPPLSPWSLRLH